MSKKIRKGDTVIVITGNEKGRTGIILSRKDDKIIVQGLNMRKKAVKQSEQNRTGFVELEGYIHISNVRVCNDENKPVKLKVRLDENNKRELFYNSNGKTITYRPIKKPRKV